jgi:hypothetical protein
MGEAKRRKQAGAYPEQTLKPSPTQRSQIDALTWQMFGSADEHPAAAKVLAGLAQVKAEAESFGPGGKLMVITLERQARDPLLSVQARGLSTFMNVIELFQSLGLEDRLESQERSENGVDAAFS